MSKLLIKLYGMSNTKIRHYLQSYIIKYDNGEFWSNTLREIYSKYHNIQIGIGSYGCFDTVKFSNGCILGNYCSIAAGVKHLSGNHRLDFVSTHPMFFNKQMGYTNQDKIVRTALTVGHDVWIGYGVIILSTCTLIGNGAVIAAGSVVTKNIEPYTIYAGVPAKAIKKRFSDDIIQGLERTKWYMKQPEELTQYVDEVENPISFIHALSGKT